MQWYNVLKGSRITHEQLRANWLLFDPAGPTSAERNTSQAWFCLELVNATLTCTLLCIKHRKMIAGLKSHQRATLDTVSVLLLSCPCPMIPPVAFHAKTSCSCPFGNRFLKTQTWPSDYQESKWFDNPPFKLEGRRLKNTIHYFIINHD